MAIETIKVPDIGGSENVDVIEVCVKEGDTVNVEDALIVLESDKASMDIPSPKAGKVVKLLLKEGDKVSLGSLVLELETDADSATASEPAAAETAKPQAAAPSPQAAPAEKPVSVPDIGGAENVDVIEVCVKVGQQVEEGESLIVLESDKASMEIPAPFAGKVVSIAIKEGDKVSEGAPVLVLAGESSGEDTPSKPEASPEKADAASGAESTLDMQVPDIGGAEGVDVIEISVKVGDQINEGDTLIVLESDKASMEVPAPASGTVASISVKEGDKVSMGSPIGTLTVKGAAQTPAKSEGSKAPAPPYAAPESSLTKQSQSPAPSTSAGDSAAAPDAAGADVYAGPAVRKLARQLGVGLGEVKASGPRGRVTKDDVRDFVKSVMQNRGKGSAVSAGAGIPPVPAVDFAQFGEVEMVKMSKIKKLTAANMSRNWLNVPHVTQFDDVDITELEDFRKAMKAEAEKAGVKLTPLPFLIKACAAALKAEPSFNVSMHADGEHIVQKHYVHIGLAVDTPNGLMVPVIRDVDKKGLFQIAAEMTELAKKARDGKLTAKEMQGGCFTLSSLGAIGGRGFTPIVNAPEVAILGISRADTQPRWNGKEFVPRLMLPLSLSYDHRAINGGDAGRFFAHLSGLLTDIRRLLL